MSAGVYALFLDELTGYSLADLRALYTATCGGAPGSRNSSTLKIAITKKRVELAGADAGAAGITCWAARGVWKSAHVCNFCRKSAVTGDSR